MKTSLLILLFLISCGKKSTTNEHSSDNGADEVRLEFISLGKEVLTKYEFMLKQAYGRGKYFEMMDVLNVERILLTDKEIYDNHDSRVSAIENQGVIKLYVGDHNKKLNWQHLLKHSPHAPKLVLHEIMRASGLEDENYRFSNRIIRPLSKIQLQFDMTLSETMVPFTSSEIIELGVRKQRELSFDHCGKAYEYDLSLTGRIQCQLTSVSPICTLTEAISGQYVMSFTTDQSKDLAMYINQNASKVILSCTYMAEQIVSCQDGHQSLTDSALCTLKFPEHFDREGKRLMGQGQQQQVQETR